MNAHQTTRVKTVVYAQTALVHILAIAQVQDSKEQTV